VDDAVVSIAALAQTQVNSELAAQLAVSATAHARDATRQAGGIQTMLDADGIPDRGC
jgi:hypothetical protein